MARSVASPNPGGYSQNPKELRNKKKVFSNNWDSWEPISVDFKCGPNRQKNDFLAVCKPNLVDQSMVKIVKLKPKYG